jgi:hypothetical protein
VQEKVKQGRKNVANTYTKPALRERLKNKIMSGTKGGKAGQWSARKAQLLASEYKKAGGGYKSGPTKKQKSLKSWTKQKWRTKSGKPSTQGPKATGERYLPEKAIKSLSSSEYARTTAAKRKGTKQGKQFVKQPKTIAKKVRKYRKTK